MTDLDGVEVDAVRVVPGQLLPAECKEAGPRSAVRALVNFLVAEPTSSIPALLWSGLVALFCMLDIMHAAYLVDGGRSGGFFQVVQSVLLVESSARLLAREYGTQFRGDYARLLTACDILYLVLFFGDALARLIEHAVYPPELCTKGSCVDDPTSLLHEVIERVYCLSRFPRFIAFSFVLLRLCWVPTPQEYVESQERAEP